MTEKISSNGVATPTDLSELGIEMTEREWLSVIDRQKTMHGKFRNTSEGTRINFMGEEFILNKNVFEPFIDTQVLAEQMLINPNEEVLDFGTGSGALAVIAAERGASHVIAIDNNPHAIKTAKENANLHEVERIMEVRSSDGFTGIHQEELFDVVIANLPFMNLESSDFAEATTWDSNLEIHAAFFENVPGHLKPNGRIYFAQANFGPLKEVQALIDASGLKWRLLGEKDISDKAPRKFYALEITNK